MATSKGTSLSVDRPHDGHEAESLSGFERRCLLKRICELHELVQLAVLGADSARDRAKVEDLASICMALHLAELQIDFAERLAARQVH